ncbi:UBN2_2 domain-containing protein [Cephalotus follicularis]|uniref:UBN2_2 domain-containing protein n=1 Tax=Cephalotus follicularis TaxID=3775 RepID=A0A1Q3B4T5_CEPFO|nr:UBN2_2 domain-containing protein [Cephalotus follicularis]
MLSSTRNDLISEFEEYQPASELWNTLKLKYGSISATKLRELTMRFDNHTMKEGQTMKHHLRVMSSMIRELKAVGHNLTDEQQVLVVLRSLPKSWDDMFMNMTHNSNINTFLDLSHHLELEAE